MVASVQLLRPLPARITVVIRGHRSLNAIQPVFLLKESGKIIALLAADAIPDEQKLYPSDDYPGLHSA
ncbi:hypothetical protein [Klebsiella pneumoniae]|uniref:hypothetical protein n=1 Tax=Klebsiella pneumoniae TaxID=573 RepID=UPI002D1E4A7F|nr:hypothetical protein [Klebsiella pneumoniae]MCY0160096.1 hypothetical protein [Klebsiella pneumoniae]